LWLALSVGCRSVPAAQRIGAQLPAARECTRLEPAAARRTHPGPGRPTGWSAGQDDWRRPVSCSALLGGDLLWRAKELGEQEQLFLLERRDLTVDGDHGLDCPDKPHAMLPGDERRIDGFRRRRLGKPHLDLAALIFVEIETISEPENKSSLCRANLEVHPSERTHEPEKKHPLGSGQFKQGIPPVV
jgi:hypothetical protein